MAEVSLWSEHNWYALGSLLTQLAFLAAGIWFLRNLLKTIRGFQEQLAALLKLPTTREFSERSLTSGVSRPSSEDASDDWLKPSETRTGNPARPTPGGPGRLTLSWHGLVCWLQAPMSTPQGSAWRRMINWLQAPAGGRGA